MFIILDEGEMAKRQTDTDKWKNKFFRGLDPIHKLFWLYIHDECDHAGIWHVDFEVASIRIGEVIFEDEMRKVFQGKIKIFDEDSKWLILPFINEQYGILKEENRVHKSVIEKLQRFGLYPEIGNNNESVDNIDKGLLSPLEGLSNSPIDKDKDKDKEININSNKLEIYKALSTLFEKPEIIRAWKQFQEMRKKIRKPMTTRAEELIIKKLHKFSNAEENMAIAILEKSIENSWQDIYELKSNDHGGNKQFYKPNQSKERNAHSGGKKTFN